jgi:hypothetical protein
MDGLRKNAPGEPSPSDKPLGWKGPRDAVRLLQAAPRRGFYAETATQFRLSLPKSRFVRIDGAGRQGLDAQQWLRTAGFGACKARPFLAKREYALHYNR